MPRLMIVLLLSALPAGCSMLREQITPREIYCKAECTPESQYIECQGLSEGTTTHDIDVQGR